jgi:hypothetical protein
MEIMKLLIDIGRIGNGARHFHSECLAKTLAQTREPGPQPRDRPSTLSGKKIAGARRVVLLVRRFRCGRGGEFLEARIVPERIEHRIEPEQRRSECATRESAIV